MQRDENLLHINNGQQIDGHSHSLPSDRDGQHPPIRSIGRSSRPDADQIQGLNRF